MRKVAEHDVRFSVPLYTQAEAARYLDMPANTLNYWTHPEASTVSDVRWMADATGAGRVLISADTRIRHNPLERRAICLYSARCLTFPRGSLTAVQMIARLEAHLAEVMRLARQPGPFV